MALSALLHSVSYSGSWGQAFLPVEDFADKAAELGYDGVLLMARRPHVSLLDYRDKERDALRSHLERHGFRRIALAGYNNFTADMEHGDVPNREIQIHYVAELARFTRDLGGDLLRVFTGYDNPVAAYPAQWKAVVDCLRECAQRAAEFGVTIGVQNHHDIACGYDTQHDLIRAVAEPNCLALFDAWAPALHGADIEAAARKMGPVTAHTTVADYQLRPRYKYDPSIVNYNALTPAVQAVPMGEGFIDYKGFLTALSESGFTGSVAYEMCSPLIDGGSVETLDRYASRFLEFMDGLRHSRAEPVATA